MPEIQTVSNWSEDDLALIKQGVGDKTGRPPSASGSASSEPSEAGGEQIGTVVTYFEDKGFGFANVFGRIEDVFIHVEVLRVSGFADLQAGEAVCLRIVDGKRGRMAMQVVTWESAARRVP